MTPNTAQSGLYCDICDTSFQRREHYQRHARTHTKEKPFTCSDCGQSFGRVDSLARHHTTIHVGTDRSDNSDRQGDRRRVAQACKPCSVSKVRCDGERPCQRCRRINHECFYEPHVKRGSYSSDLNGPKRARTFDHAPISPHSIVPDKCSDDAGHPGSTELMPQPSLPMPQETAEIVTATQPLDTQPGIDLGRESVQLDSQSSSTTISQPLDMAGIIPTPSVFLNDISENASWMNQDFGMDFMPILSLHEPTLDFSLNDIWMESAESDPLPPPIINPASSSILDKPSIAELYSRSHSPAIDEDAVEPREYRPISLEVDAQLVFPDLSYLTEEDVDDENLAHVDDISAHVTDQILQSASKMQREPNYPKFIELRIPPVRVMNAWIQLYFEFFHPIFPIIHKPSFSASGTHWLLIFSVSAIGAHYSNIKEAQSCARAMHELVRQMTSTLCEQQNQNGRELWMNQTIVLNHIGLLYCGERRNLEIGEVLQSVVIATGRRKRLFVNMFSTDKISKLDLPLGQKWQIWLLDEERRRTGFAIWLLDSAFHAHFDLTRLMTLAELQISFPSTDDRWGASTAQSWASFPVTQGSGDSVTIEQVILSHSWKLTWAKTNTLGKQVMLQHLSDVIDSEQTGRPGVPGFSQNETTQAHEALANLLDVIENESPEQSIGDLKAIAVHQIMALSALMRHNSRTRNLAQAAIKFIYGKMDDDSWSYLAEQWRASPEQTRLACFYASRILHVVRSNYCAHFGTPISLLRATTVLWTYSMLASRYPDDFLQAPPASIVVLGIKPLKDADGTEWIQSGWNRVKLPGIGNLTCAQGRTKLLDESIMLMRSLKAWGISSAYSHILVRLRASETS